MHRSSLHPAASMRGRTAFCPERALSGSCMGREMAEEWRKKTTQRRVDERRHSFPTGKNPPDLPSQGKFDATLGQHGDWPSRMKAKDASTVIRSPTIPTSAAHAHSQPGALQSAIVSTALGSLYKSSFEHPTSTFGFRLGWHVLVFDGLPCSPLDGVRRGPGCRTYGAKPTT